jgi:hypothetical protein
MLVLDDGNEEGGRGLAPTPFINHDERLKS